MRVCRLRWMANFEVGVDELDADHRAMYDLMIEISRSIQCGDRAAMSQQMTAFIELAAEHVEREDRLLCLIEPAHALRNGAAADRLRAVQELAADIEVAGSPLDLEDVPARLADWFCRQAIGHDARIRAHFHRATMPRSLRGIPSRAPEASAGQGVYTAAGECSG